MSNWFKYGYAIPIFTICISLVGLILVFIGRISESVLLIAAPMFMAGIFIFAIVYVVRRNDKERKNGKEK